MKPSQAYIVGFVQGCQDQEKDETPIPEKCLPAYGDGHEAGRSAHGDNTDVGRRIRARAPSVAKGFDVLDEVNEKAFATWNLGGQHPELPSPPPASGCRFHYCWMPVDTKDDNHACKAHGGKDAPLPKKKER
jgi:hypothetical protein